LGETAVFEPAAGTDFKDPAFLRLVLGAVRQQDAPGGLAFRLEALDDDAVAQRFDLHASPRNPLGGWILLVRCDPPACKSCALVGLTRNDLPDKQLWRMANTSVHGCPAKLAR